MYQIVHGTAGLLIGSQTGNPWLAFILGFLSHFVLDAIPHDIIEIKKWKDKGNFIKKTAFEVIVDLFLLITIIIILQASDLLNLNWAILAGIAGTICPDYIWGFGELFKIKNKWLKKYKKLHNLDHALFYKNVYVPFKYGMPIQLFFTVMFLLLFLLL